MKILYVISGNKNKLSSFIQEQTDSIKAKGVLIDFFFIKGKGAWGYLKNILNYYSKIDRFRPDIVHAHYGLSGLFANLQFKVPVITTFHGSDVNLKNVLPFSFLAYKLSNYSIFVSSKIATKLSPKTKYSIIPCGVDTDIFYPLDKKAIREKLGYSQHEKLILFSSDFENKVKNYPLAKKALEMLTEKATIIELKGYSREQVNELLNVSDVALMTSFFEGSPQFIKEAMACNLPIVSTDVGDVQEQIDGVDGCFLTSYNALDIKEAIEKAFSFGKKTTGKNKIYNVSLDYIASRIFEVYLTIATKKMNN